MMNDELALSEPVLHEAGVEGRVEIKHFTAKNMRERV